MIMKIFEKENQKVHCKCQMKDKRIDFYRKNNIKNVN